MENYANYATMKAKEGQERQVEAFLESLLALAEIERGTKHWFALRRHDQSYSIFKPLKTESPAGSILEARSRRRCNNTPLRFLRESCS